MFWILIVGIFMGALSAVFWCLESIPFIKQVKFLKKPSSKNPFKLAMETARYTVGFLHALLYLIYLAIDILATIWLAGSFGFSGMIGGVIGLTISNIISIFLLIISKKTNQDPPDRQGGGIY